MNQELHLSRRERQIVDVLHTRTAATAAEVRAAMPNPPSYSTVRALLRILEEKGHVKHRQDGPRYIYLPCMSRQKASHSAFQRILQTFFGGSVDQAVAGLLEAADTRLSETELEALKGIIAQAERKERK